MSLRNDRYEDFWDTINVDAFEEAIGWSPEYEHNGNDVGFCVFPENHAHGDTTGKFAIEREMRVYNCWACGGGSLLSLTMELLDKDMDEATAWLRQFCEEDLRSDTEFADDFMDAFRDVEKRIDTLPYFNNRVLDRFGDPIEEAMEWNKEYQEYIPFLANRWIRDEAVELYGLRYGAEIFRPAPQRGKFSEDDDYCGPGVIFPHYWQGRLVGWQTRWLEEERPEWVPKYTMTSDFPKETTIYGWDQARTTYAVIVVESVTSVNFLRSCGYPAVATFGSNVNDAQMRLLRRFSHVILSADNDKPSKQNGNPPGIRWRDHLTNYLKDYTQVRWLPLIGEKGSNADVGDLAKTVDPEQSLKDYLDMTYDPFLDDPADT